MTDLEETLEITRHEGVSLSIKSKRGTGTNDRDEVKGKVHAQDLEELSEKAPQMREQVNAEMAELRENQPDEDEDDEEDES